ncbi:MAG: saccharopine dehydrogenase NADP-binding domain-containing protein [Acidobacteria bacterium]|nr:saccharopine dehydrogenase NADP-binding domain-containing protein [Acidobacteriota bacterium]
MSNRIVILGGYGNAGAIIARLLASESNLAIVLAGRHLKKAQRTASVINDECRTDRVSARQVDASDNHSLVDALKDAAIVVVASSTIQHARVVAEAALAAGVDYFDIQISSSAKLAVLNSLKQQIEASGRCFMTDGGFRPGIPAAMVRYAAALMPRLESCRVASAFQLNWKNHEFADSSAEEFVDELESYNPLILQDGAWVRAKMSLMPRFDFGEPFGQKYCTPMLLEEFRALPGIIPALRQTGFYSAGFGGIVDYAIIPTSLLMIKLFPGRSRRLVGRMFKWGLMNFTKPPYGAVLRMDAAEGKEAMRMLVSHPDAYFLTAASAAACLSQYFDGTIRGPGLRFQAHAVEPGRFFQKLAQYGIQVLTDKEVLPS